MENMQIAFIAASVVAAPFIALFTTPIAVLMYKMFCIPFMRKKLLEKAITDGHIVQAKLVRERADYDPNDRLTDVATSRVTSGKYEYEYQGKVYYTHSTGSLPRSNIPVIKAPGNR